MIVAQNQPFKPATHPPSHLRRTQFDFILQCVTKEAALQQIPRTRLMNKGWKACVLRRRWHYEEYKWKSVRTNVLPTFDIHVAVCPEPRPPP